MVALERDRLVVKRQTDSGARPPEAAWRAPLAAAAETIERRARAAGRGLASDAIGLLRWRAPARHAYSPRHLDGVVDCLARNRGNFFLLGDATTSLHHTGTALSPSRALVPSGHGHAAVRFGFAAAACAAVAIAFYHEILFGGALIGYDWFFHFHYYDWIRVSLIQYGTLPLFMADASHTPNFLANPQSPLLGPLVWLLAVIPADAYIKLLIVLYTAAGLLGANLLLRDLRVSAPLAILGSLALAFNGYAVAHVAVGHHWSLGSQLLPALVLLFRRASGGSRGAIVAAGALGAITLLEGQHHPFLWNHGFLLLLGVWLSVRERRLRPLAAALAICALSAGLAGVRLLPLLAEFRDYAPRLRIRGIPPLVLLWSLVVPGQSAHTSGFGIEYAHGSGWWEYAFYLGAPLLGVLMLGAAAASRRCWPLLAAAAPFLFLALDLSAWHPSLDPWLWLQDLPGANTQRSPARLASVGLFALVITGSVGWQRIWEHLRARAGWRRVLPAAAVLLCVATAIDLYRAARPWERDAVGAPLASRSHRLPLPFLRGDRAGHVEEAAFAPNRLVYRVVTTRDARLVFPMHYVRHRLQWRAEGLTSEAYGQAYALRLPPGSHDVVLHFRPRALGAGVALSGVTLLGLAIAALHARRGPSSRGDDEHRADRNEQR